MGGRGASSGATDYVPFDFHSYTKGDHLTSQQLYDSLPQSMDRVVTYDGQTAASVASARIAAFTGDGWNEYRDDPYINEAIDGTSKPFQGAMFRGITMQKSELDSIGVGSTLRPVGIQSWSSDHEVAASFAKVNYEPVLIVDRTKGRKSALSIQSLSGSYAEHEVITSQDCRFKVRRKYVAKIPTPNNPYRKEKQVTIIEVNEVARSK